jgi:hypothetical protein
MPTSAGNCLSERGVMVKASVYDIRDTSTTTELGQMPRVRYDIFVDEHE